MKRAVTLGIRDGIPPEVCERGLGAEAQELVRFARRYGIPIIEDEELAKALSELDSPSIPEELFYSLAKALLKKNT